MARKPTSAIVWPSLTLEGNLIAPAMLAHITDPDIAGAEADNYGIRKGLTLREEISQAFRVGQAHFDDFAKLAMPTPEATARFVRGLLTQAFGFSDLTSAAIPLAFIAGDGRIPIAVCPPSDALDKRSAFLSLDRPRSAAYAVQDHLNAQDDALWGLATNGHHLRLMRDNASLTRPAHIEADLRQIFTTEDIASFTALWLLIHRSRFGLAGTPATDCALERWRDQGARQGETARNRLAGQVEEALKLLGTGFLDANPDLRAKVQSGEIPLTDYFNELLRLVYRLIFLMVAEDRDLLHAEATPLPARDLYARGYSLTALRRTATRRAAWDRHTDRWEGLQVTFRALATGQPRLGLTALGGLFAPTALHHLTTAKLQNRAFLHALWKLSWLSDGTAMVPVNWRAMETEELGSVYESLLELQPQLDGTRLIFATDAAEQKGNQRKTTGSYYTPDSLVQALLDTALDPVLDQCEAAADPAQALLKLKVIDPACGSGHFLLAAARRIATRLARARSPGTPSAADYRHALRDAARACLHGVDRNPMAVELTKVALWIETVDPGKPLGFFDAQIRCGDALLGLFDLRALDHGIPDAAYKPLVGDDKPTAKHYATKNRKERAEAARIAQGFDLSRRTRIIADHQAMRAMPEDDLPSIEAKARRAAALSAPGSDAALLHRAADLWISAFLAPKITPERVQGEGGLPRRGAETIATSGMVWEYLRGIEPAQVLEIEKALTGARAFHWPLEFPDVFAEGGFDVVLGNPPYGAEVEPRAREFIKAVHAVTVGASNTCADFIDLSLSMLRSGGMFGLVVPKSVTYSNAWSGVRSIVLPRLVCTIDISQAWEHVALEMVLLFCAKDEQTSEQVCLQRGLGTSPSWVPREMAQLLGIIPTGLTDMDRQLLIAIQDFLAPNRTSAFSTTRGKGLQRLAQSEGDIELLAGRNIAPLSLKGPWKFISIDRIEADGIVPAGALVFQNIVAHLTNPTDHIRLIGTVIDRSTVALDTVNIIHCSPNVSARAAAVYLMSDFVCWFVYVAGFNRAVRTMHFDNYILQKLPAIPDALFLALEEFCARSDKQWGAGTWKAANEIINEAYGLGAEHSTYLRQMHSEKGN